MSKKSIHYQAKESAGFANASEIVEHYHEEHSPFASMSHEEAKKRLAEMIQKYADWRVLDWQDQLFKARHK